MNLTKHDAQHASRYAQNMFRRYKLEEYKKSHPYIFSHVIKTERAATNRDYYVPGRLAGKCMVVSLAFNETGCRKISCYPFRQGETLCERGDSANVQHYGNGHTFGCQPACFELNGAAYDTFFHRGTCRLANTLIKQYAINPKSRSNYYPSLPFHSGLDVRVDDTTGTQTLALNDAYCQAHGLILSSDGNCVTTSAQIAGELFTGSTIYRSLRIMTSPPSVTAPRTHIPWDIATESRWRAGAQVAPARTQLALPSGVIDIPDNLLVDVAANLAADLGVHFTIKQVEKILKNTVPAQILKTANAATLSTVLNVNRGVQLLRGVETASRVLGSALNMANAAMAIFSIGVMITDIVDPLEFNEVLTKHQVQQASYILNSDFDAINIVTPESVWQKMEEANGDMVTKTDFDLIQQWVDEYIGALDMTVSGQKLRSDVIRENIIMREEKRDRRFKVRSALIYHCLVTSTFFLLGITFVRAIHYVVFFYLCFLIFFNALIHNDFDLIREGIMLAS